MTFVVCLFQACPVYTWAIPQRSITTPTTYTPLLLPGNITRTRPSRYTRSQCRRRQLSAITIRCLGVGAYLRPCPHRDTILYRECGVKSASPGRTQGPRWKCKCTRTQLQIDRKGTKKCHPWIFQVWTRTTTACLEKQTNRNKQLRRCDVRYFFRSCSTSIFPSRRAYIVWRRDHSVSTYWTGRIR